MRYSINNYVEAFTEVMAGASSLPAQAGDKKDKLTASFLKLLQKTGDIKHAKKILEAVHKKIINKKGGKWVNIETARKISESQNKSLKHKFSEKDHVEFKINPELVAGVRITVNGEEELNNSLQNKLNKLFK